jgi:hypothetical protein
VRVAIGPLPLQLVYQPGTSLHFTWCALPDPLQVTTQPVPETLTAGFIGPFATSAAAQAGSRSLASLHLPGPLVASIAPIQTTTWSGSDASAPVTLPATMAAGYYIYFEQDDIAAHTCVDRTGSGCRGGGRASGIVQIASA